MNQNTPKKTWQNPELTLISQGYVAGAGPVLVLEKSVAGSLPAPMHPGHFYLITPNTTKLGSHIKGFYHS